MDALAPVVGIGAAIASLGVLLNLIPGVAVRRWRWRAATSCRRRWRIVDRRRSHPVRAELAVVAVVLVLVVVVELRSAIALSGVAVLTYYAITNAAAFTLRPDERRWPRWICVAGAIGCVALAVFLPLEVVIVGTAVLLLGVVFRRLARDHLDPRQLDQGSDRVDVACCCCHAERLFEHLDRELRPARPVRIRHVDLAAVDRERVRIEPCAVSTRFTSACLIFLSRKTMWRYLGSTPAFNPGWLSASLSISLRAAHHDRHFQAVLLGQAPCAARRSTATSSPFASNTTFPLWM